YLLAPRLVIQINIVTMHEYQVGNLLSVLEKGVEGVHATGKETPHPPRTWRTGYTRPGRLDGHRPVAIEPARENTHEPPLVFHKQLGNRLLDAQLTARTHGTECQHSQRGFRVSGQRQVGTGEIHLITAPRQLNVVVDTCTLPATRPHRNDLLHTRRHVLAP